MTALALGAWLWGCAAANHPVPGFDRLHERAGGLDVWLPRWRFFAPEPVSWDMVLRYRLDAATGTATDGWQDLPVARTRDWTALLLNPDRRRLKALLQVGRTIARRAAADGADALREDWQHRLLVAFVLQELRRQGLDHGASTVRFALVEDPGHDPTRSARVRYESEDVPIPSRQGQVPDPTRGAAAGTGGCSTRSPAGAAGSPTTTCASRPPGRCSRPPAVPASP